MCERRETTAAHCVTTVQQLRDDDAPDECDSPSPRLCAAAHLRRPSLSDDHSIRIRDNGTRGSGRRHREKWGRREKEEGDRMEQASGMSEAAGDSEREG